MANIIDKAWFSAKLDEVLVDSYGVDTDYTIRNHKLVHRDVYIPMRKAVAQKYAYYKQNVSELKRDTDSMLATCLRERGIK